MTVVDEPAVARAIDRCLVARSLAGRRGAVTRVHPRPCGWCEFPLGQLKAWLEGFNAWAGWNERSRSYERHDVRVWTEQARRDPEAAEAEIVRAQDFPEAMEERAEPVAHDQPPAAPVDEELAAWT